LAIGGAALIITGLICVVIYFLSTKSKIDGETTVAGLSAPVTIKFDENAVPHIKALNNEDAVYALGYLHARERTWQMEFNRRLASGKLSEILGPEALSTDKFIRTLGIRRAAEQQLENFPLESKRMIQAYSDGVNEGFKSLGWALPAEFMILGTQPGQWSPADSVAWTLMMALDLGGNWNKEFLRLELSKELDTQQIWEVLPPYPGENPATSINFAQMYREMGLFKNKGTQQSKLPSSSFEIPGITEGIGSNNWVVNGDKSATGKPWLANDPHLNLTAPAVWYFAHIDAPNIKTIGATLPGMPIVVLGRTTNLAWGFTNTGPDVQDLYIEALDPSNPSRYKTGQGFENFSFREERIQIKGKEAERFIVRETRHGPVISDVYDRAKNLIDTDHFAISMRWTALDTGNQTLVAGLDMNRAETLDDFKLALKKYYAPMQNVVMADVNGNIAYRALGAVPKRVKGQGLFGVAPALGWDKQYDWHGYISLEALPQDNNPSKGWIATANQRVQGPNDPNPLTSDWDLPYRYNRIESLLEAESKHDLASMKAIQLDTVSLYALELLPFLKTAESNHPATQEAMAVISEYDGNMKMDSAGAAIFNAWTDQLTRRLFQEKLGKSFEYEYGKNSFRAGLKKILEMNATGNPAAAFWCDKKSTPEVETCEQAINEAFTLALTELSSELGKHPKSWRWGDIHIAISEHRPFSKASFLKNRFEVKRAVPGDNFTINVGTVNFNNKAALFTVNQAPSLRTIYDFSNLDKSQFIYQTGQSGWVNSHNYQNYANLWAKGEYLPLTMSPNTISHTATLKPNPESSPIENKKPEVKAPERKKKKK
jgi:penicillin amidase